MNKFQNKGVDATGNSMTIKYQVETPKYLDGSKCHLSFT
jgi:hypothetical protein